MASATPTSQQLSCPKEKLCAVCKKHDVDLSTCNQCCSIWYCSKACQTADWKLHKLLCKAFSEAIRPQDTTGKTVYRRVIFFHPDKGVPEIQWRDQRGENNQCLYKLLREGAKSNPKQRNIRI